MKAEMLKRLFRAINDDSSDDLRKVAAAIIEQEKNLGHGRLAGQLTKILAEDTAEDRRQLRALPQVSRIRLDAPEVPKSRRYQEPLAYLVPRDRLRHHMVLPPSVEKRFQRIEFEYAARTRLQKHGLRPRQRMLLHGPPGCGKSLGAERLAWTTGLPLLKVRFDSIMSSFFGESASNLWRVFDSARKAPILLFLDECDFVASARNRKNEVGEVPRIVNVLLQLLDDYDAPGLLVAATNLEESLDSAIFRRFDDVFEVPRPGQKEIRELLVWSLSGIEVAKKISWTRIASQLKSASAASVVKVGENAAKAALLSGELPVREKHLTSAIKELRSGV